MRSLNEPRREICALGCDGGASICGIAGTSILGGGGGAGGGGLNCDPPGASICAEAAFATTSATTIAQTKIDTGFMKPMSGRPAQTATLIILQFSIEAVGPKIDD
jgi:hypothetical protein